MDDTLLRAVRLAVAANSRFPGITPHHWTCASERGPGEDCDCGADHLNESLELLSKALFESTGRKQPWYPTGEELTQEINELTEKLP